MEKKWKKISHCCWLACLFFFVFILVMMKIENKRKPAISDNEIMENSSSIKNAEPVSSLTRDEKDKLENVENIAGRINFINVGSIKISTNKGELILKIPQKEVTFTMNVLQKDGSFISRKIGLLDLPKDKDVDVSYNSKTSELISILVK
ncbi:MAG: hypothetical protein WA055_03715 [Candidatus Moraniibacteriota bacterium]